MDCADEGCTRFVLDGMRVARAVDVLALLAWIGRGMADRLEAVLEFSGGLLLADFLVVGIVGSPGSEMMENLTRRRE